MYRLAVVSLLLFGAVSLSQGQLTYAKIDVPGAVATEARGINNFGEIVGFYKTVACTDYEIEVPNCYTKGLKYLKGTFTRLMVPKASSISAPKDLQGKTVVVTKGTTNEQAMHILDKKFSLALNIVASPDHEQSW